VIVHKQRRARAALRDEARDERGAGAQLGLSQTTALDGSQVVRVTGELDVATAEQAYVYFSDVIDQGHTPVSIDLGGLTFCDASGLSVFARAANRAREAGRQLKLTGARPSLVKIMRITGMDAAFPELTSPAAAR
jgi:anti-sigma B factor antagonist